MPEIWDEKSELCLDGQEPNEFCQDGQANALTSRSAASHFFGRSSFTVHRVFALSLFAIVQFGRLSMLASFKYFVGAPFPGFKHKVTCPTSSSK
mmetsp:Transcript_126773/g.340178  ORF Transcript_126773/g.340178 Transcript_126773/m.340178 type:complete len:94 (+) Transcript_126773:61-342(+)